MAYAATPWGYDVDGTIPELLDLQDFHKMTENAFVDDGRIQSAIGSVVSGLRTWCGWHIATNTACRCVLDGGSTSIWLPSTHVTAVASVTVCGEDVTDSCEWSQRGLLRIPYSPDRLRAIEVEFSSGLETVPEELKGIVVNRVLHQVMVPFGIQSEAIGTTSRTYDTNAADGLGSAHKSPSDYTALTAYRLTEV